MKNIVIVEDVDLDRELLRQLPEGDFPAEPIDETLLVDKIGSCIGN